MFTSALGFGALDFRALRLGSRNVIKLSAYLPAASTLPNMAPVHVVHPTFLVGNKEYIVLELYSGCLVPTKN